jgi:hypothetical protein
VTKIAESLDRVIATRMRNAGPGWKRAALRPKDKTPALEPGAPGTSEQEQASIDALRDN